MSKFKNHNKNKPYKTFLYKRKDGKTVSKIFTGEDVAADAMNDGWCMSLADLVEEVTKDSELGDEEKELLKDAGDDFSRDADLLANCDKVEDVTRLKEAYARISGKDLNDNITSIKTVRLKCTELLGEINSESNGQE